MEMLGSKSSVINRTLFPCDLLEIVTAPRTHTQGHHGNHSFMMESSNSISMQISKEDIHLLYWLKGIRNIFRNKEIMTFVSFILDRPSYIVIFSHAHGKALKYYILSEQVTI